jgi:hypothetical protein
LGDIYLVPILERLAFNSHIRTVVIRGPTPSLVTSNAVRRFLESTTTIEGFELVGCRHDEETILPISQGLINSESITDIKFVGCYYKEGSTILFKSVLVSKSKIRSLAIVNCNVRAGQLTAPVFTNLLGPDSSLRSFELRDIDLNAFGCTVSLTTAVEKSQLEHVCIKTIETQDICQALINSIPKMQVKLLEVGLGENQEHMKPDIIRVVQKTPGFVIILGLLYM